MVVLINAGDCSEEVDLNLHAVIGNIYLLNIEHALFHELSCLVSKMGDSWLWHRRAAHTNMHHLNHLVKKDLVIGIPKLKFEKNKLCEACQKGKQVKNPFQSKNVVYFKTPGTTSYEFIWTIKNYEFRW